MPSVLDISNAKRHRRGRIRRPFRAWLTAKPGHWKCFWVYPLGHEWGAQELEKGHFTYSRRCSICKKRTTW